MSSNCESRELAKLSVLSGRKGWHTLSLLSMTVRLAMSSFMQRADKTFHQGCCVALWYCTSSSGFMCHGESMCLHHPSWFLGVLWYRWLSFWVGIAKNKLRRKWGRKTTFTNGTSLFIISPLSLSSSRNSTSVHSAETKLKLSCQHCAWHLIDC